MLAAGSFLIGTAGLLVTSREPARTMPFTPPVRVEVASPSPGSNNPQSSAQPTTPAADAALPVGAGLPDAPAGSPIDDPSAAVQVLTPEPLPSVAAASAASASAHELVPTVVPAGPPVHILLVGRDGDSPQATETPASAR
jgi:hypothetical protein